MALVLFSYAIAKVAGVFALVFFGYAAYGAIFGYLMRPLVGLALGWYFFKFESQPNANLAFRSVPRSRICVQALQDLD